MKSRIVMFIIAFAIWCMLTWIPNWQSLLVGALAALIVAILTGDLFEGGLHKLKHPYRYWYVFAIYLPRFLWECLVANIDVAYRVLHPNLPINPGIVKVKTKLKSDVGLTFLANTITLTPGTMTVDVDKEKGLLYIHWINVKGKDVEAATKQIVEKFEHTLIKIFE